MDSILEAIVEFIKFVLWNIFWSFVLFNIGRIFLLLITLGNYPRGEKLEKDVNLISGVGVGVLFAIWSIIAIYNNWGLYVGTATEPYVRRDAPPIGDAPFNSTLG